MATKRIKDRIDGEEIDFSLSELTEAPEKDLALYPKATHVDLSRNHLTSLTPTFPQLKHIVKLDLSKNNLNELPTNFGNLNKLQHLDLYGNKLVMLPVSFCHLKSLKWLDLKDNPLDKQLAKVAGDCLEEKQCKACATNVVAFMKSIQSQLDRERHKRQKEEHELQQKLKAAEEEEKMRKKMEKKLEKEKRKADHLARQKELELRSKQQSEEKGIPKLVKSQKENVTEAKKIHPTTKSRSCLCSCFLSIIKLILLSIVLITAIVLYDHYKQNQQFTSDKLQVTFMKYYSLAHKHGYKIYDVFIKWADDAFIKLNQFYKINIKNN